MHVYLSRQRGGYRELVPECIPAAMLGRLEGIARDDVLAYFRIGQRQGATGLSLGLTDMGTGTVPG